jgi:hypothetical protein
VSGAERLRQMPRCAGRVVFIRWEREVLELNFINSEYFLRISKGCGLAFNIFLADVSQLYHIVNIRHFRRPVPKNINHDG